jgi:hypothetical protein
MRMQKQIIRSYMPFLLTTNTIKLKVNELAYEMCVSRRIRPRDQYEN